jgi:hypothetical protein
LDDVQAANDLGDGKVCGRLPQATDLAQCRIFGGYQRARGFVALYLAHPILKDALELDRAKLRWRQIEILNVPVVPLLEKALRLQSIFDDHEKRQATAVRHRGFDVVPGRRQLDVCQLSFPGTSSFFDAGREEAAFERDDDCATATV